MLFAYDTITIKLYKKIKKENCISLQVQSGIRSPHGMDVLFHRERAFLFTSLNKRKTASLSLEAAIVLPLFLLFLIDLLYFMVILHFQLQLQTCLEDIARDMAQYAFISTKMEGMVKEEFQEAGKTFGIPEQLLADGMNTLYVKSKLIEKLELEEESPFYLAGGKEGLNLFFSDLSNQDHIYDIIVQYEVNIPFLPEAVQSFHMIQRCRFKGWTGEEESKEDTAQESVVYITVNGTVYHTFKDCTHLKLSIQKVTKASLSFQRNDWGEEYHRCVLCSKMLPVDNQYVYITTNGDCYHNSIACSGLKRNVIEVKKSEIGNRKLCNRCSERGEND